MKDYRRTFIRRVITSSHGLTIVALVSVTIVVALAIGACAPVPKSEPAPPAALAPVPIGMKFGERYHEIHTNKLALKCEVCHSEVTTTYYDPLAQVANAVDKRACLSCHKEDTVQPFYGEAWGKAKVK